jgi:hypothetical protein
MPVTYENYYCDSETLTSLRQVCTRLYSDKPLVGDERRDLANRMEALLGHIDTAPVKEDFTMTAHEPNLGRGTLYDQIEKTAKPIVTNYWTDVALHDKASLARMKTGDQLLWACRDYGSHIAWLVWSDVRAETGSKLQRISMNRSVFQSANQIWPGMQWYLLTATSDNGRGTMVKISVEEAERLFADLISSTLD